MYCTWAACCEGMGVHLMHTVLYNMRLCEVWVCKQLDEGWDEAPHPTDCQTTAAMIDIVLIVMWYIDHTIKTSMVDLYLHMQCVTVAISHPLLVSCTHVDIFVSIYTYLYIYIYIRNTYSYSYIYMVTPPSGTLVFLRVVAWKQVWQSVCIVWCASFCVQYLVQLLHIPLHGYSDEPVSATSFWDPRLKLF